MSTTVFTRRATQATAIEWRTLMVIGLCYAVWATGGLLHAADGWLGITLLALAITLHSSLQHEAIHRHPTRRAGWNEALVFLPLGLLVPFRRYRDLHLRHHVDDRLTDPHDDPESFYHTLYDLERLPGAVRIVLAWNNILLVRLLIGPLVSAVGFVLTEFRAFARADRREARARGAAWALHAIGVAMVVAIVQLVFAMPIGAYLAAAYLGQTLLALRSFCEHQWQQVPEHRTVIVERSLLGPLFLNNNLHLVHHKHPALPWYELPAAYRARRAEWRAINGGYVFDSYGAVIRRFALRSKEPVAHPVRAITRM